MNDLSFSKSHNFRFLKSLDNLKNLSVKYHSCYSLKNRDILKALGNKQFLEKLDFRMNDWERPDVFTEKDY